MADLPGISIESLEPAAENDRREALGLLDAELGNGLYSGADLLQAAADPTATLIIARSARRVVAVAIGRVQVPEDVEYYLRFGERARRIFERGPVGSLEALAVDPAHRRGGLGGELVRLRLAWFREQGCADAVAVSWVPSGRSSATSAPLFRHLGFREGALVADFYLEESRRDGWSCPADGNPCRCAAIMFWLDLEPSSA